MLGQRVVTALVLLALLVPAVASRNPMWLGLVGAVVLAAGYWEWARLNGLRGWGAWLGASLVLLIGLAVWLAPPLAFLREASRWALWCVSALWVVLLVRVLGVGPGGWQRFPAAIRLLFGALALWTLWLAVMDLHAVGTGYLLSVLAVVWVADIGAYFGGRAWGRRKLAPRISPGKTLEGAWAGAASVLLVAGVWVWVLPLWGWQAPNLFGDLWRLGPAWAVVVLGGLTVASITGDLFESLLKREAGVKDSSSLLPGHGGVLDRIDALLPVLPLAAALLPWLR